MLVISSREFRENQAQYFDLADSRKLIKELHEHPRIGTRKPELMKHGKLKSLWSRRITSKHRLIYSIIDSKIVVLIISVNSHYANR